ARIARRDHALVRAELAEDRVARAVEAHAALQHHPEARGVGVVMQIVLAAVLLHHLHGASHDVIASEIDEALAGIDARGPFVTVGRPVGFRLFVTLEQFVVVRFHDRHLQAPYGPRFVDYFPTIVSLAAATTSGGIA